MCGITGLVGPTNSPPVDQALLRRMCDLLAHRGPDGDGFYVNGPVGLGHRRLSIIDLPHGGQPIFNEDKSVAIVFNGEIYNFRELRASLQSQGHEFATNSDTEVIVHLYEEKGTDCLGDLRGMFAFAIWDERKKQLFAAIDRVGKKPFYYSTHGGVMRFASELKSIWIDPSFPREIDPIAVDDFLAYQYVPAPRTIWRHAQKLEPGHALLWHEGALKVWRYWDLEYEPKTRISEANAVEAVEAAVDDAVRSRLESDVPLGVFLSGGVDSSLVVAMMRRHVSGPLRTFSIGFHERDFDELPYARRVAERFETEHHEFVLEPNALEIMPKMAWHFDEPMADPAALATWYLAEMTRKHVTVALNGDGGDESFAGYRRYRGLEFYHWYRAYMRLPEVMRRVADRTLLPVLSRIFPSNPKLAELNHLNWITLQPAARQYVLLMNTMRDDVRHWLYDERFKTGLAGHDSAALITTPYNDSRLREEVDRRMFADIRTYLPGALLPKVDRMTMAFGLEGRSPLLDHRLMELAARFPAEVKFPHGDLKHLLRQVAARHIPPEWLDRPKKGFGVPVGHWFRGEFRSWTRDLLTSPKAMSRGLFDAGRMQRYIRQHEMKQANHARGLYALACLELWFREFGDKR